MADQPVEAATNSVPAEEPMDTTEAATTQTAEQVDSAPQDSNTSEKEYVLLSSDSMKIESDPNTLSQFTADAINCAALDTCCTSSVAGERWMKIYLLFITVIQLVMIANGLNIPMLVQ